jgi:hypothetical protein
MSLDISEGKKKKKKKKGKRGIENEKMNIG